MAQEVKSGSRNRRTSRLPTDWSRDGTSGALLRNRSRNQTGFMGSAPYRTARETQTLPANSFQRTGRAFFPGTESALGGVSIR